PVSHYCVRCLFTTHTPPTPPLLPYTTLFRSPRLANFDDFEPLAAEPGVRLRFVTTAAALRAADLVVLPGSKSTMADLAWLHATGLAAAVVGVAAAGRPVLGVCGGFQMLGEALRDPERVESEREAAAGLGLLPA